jgi:L-asparaginase/Glu-tRNA(Gln) amidotransferase subunit D
VAARRFLREQGFVAAGALPPHKARILLMLALTAESDPTRLQVLFDAAEGD